MPARLHSTKLEAQLVQSDDVVLMPAAPCPIAPGDNQIHGLHSHPQDEKLYFYQARIGMTKVQGEAPDCPQPHGSSSWHHCRWSPVL